MIVIVDIDDANQLEARNTGIIGTNLGCIYGVISPRTRHDIDLLPNNLNLDLRHSLSRMIVCCSIVWSVVKRDFDTLLT